MSGQALAAVDIDSWQSLSQNIQNQTDDSFVLVSDITAQGQIESADSLTLDANHFAISGESIAERGFLLRQGLSLSNTGSFSIGTDGAVTVSGGISGFSNGALAIQGSAINNRVEVNVANVVFHHNSTVGGGAGGALQYVEDTRGFNQRPDNHISIRDSVFYENSAAYGGAVMIDRSVDTLISGSRFQNNTAASGGGALTVARSQNLVIRDTDFIGNTASGGSGGAIYIGVDSPQPIQFGGGYTVESVLDAKYDAWDGYTPSESMNISIEAVEKDVLFSGNQADKGSDIYIDYGIASPSSSGSMRHPDGEANVNLMLGAAEGRVLRFDGDICAEGETNTPYSDNSFSLHINKEKDQLGEVVFNGKVTADQDPMLYFYRGTISLGSDQSLYEMPITMDDPSAELRALNLAQGKVEKYTFGGLYLKNDGAYSLDLYADVDLSTSTVDTIDWGDIDTAGSTLEVRVSGWNVINDISAGVQNTQVTINAGNSDNDLTYALGIDGEKATGALYIYDVALIDGDSGTYEFSVSGKADPDPAPMKPSDFNAEAYAGAVTQKLAQVLQHEISHRLFDSNMPVNSLSATTVGNLTGAALGGQASLELSDYGSSDIDIDYGIALFSYLASPISIGSVRSSFGVYGGFVTASTEDHVNDINSRGAFVGLAAKNMLGNSFADFHANIGLLDNDLGSKLGGLSSSDNIWFGAGLSLGHEFHIKNNELAIIPSVDVVYAYVNGDDFTTPHNVQIDNSGFSSWEFSPGVRFDGSFGPMRSWSIYGEARYVWTNDSMDVSAIGLTDNDNHPITDQILPDLEFGDYAEFNFGIKKEVGSWRISGGIDYRFGDVDGWGAGFEARLNF